MIGKLAIVFVVMMGAALASPTFWHGKHQHHVIHVPYHVHTYHHHHVEKIPIIKHVPVYKEIHVPVYKPVHVPIYKEHIETDWNKGGWNSGWW